MLPISLIIPTINEAENILYVLSRCTDVAEVIVVDGGSTDGTVELIENSPYPARVIVHREPGKGKAMRVGLTHATQPFVVFMDADGSMDPSELVKFNDLFHEGFQMVKGSRALGTSYDLTWFRSLGNWGLTKMFNSLYGTSHTDLCYGYIGFSQDALAALDLASTGFEIESELIARAAVLGLDTTEFDSVEYPRMHGTSNLHPIRDGARVLREILKHRRTDVDVQPVWTYQAG